MGLDLTFGSFVFAIYPEVWELGLEKEVAAVNPKEWSTRFRVQCVRV